MIVGIAGGTASGKTTIAHALAARLDALLVTQDRYYLDATPDTNFDHPDALDLERLVADLDRLRAGQIAELPDYDFATHTRRPAVERVAPRAVVIVEGILVLADARLRDRFDLRVWVEAPADVRLVRRVQRDVAERGRTVEGVFAQYLATVRPMHVRHCEPSATHASLVLDGTGDLAAEVERAVARIRG